MKKSFLALLVLVCLNVSAQTFIDHGMIEYEVRINNHKVFGDGIWAQMFKDKMPQFSTSWYQLTFSDNKAVYKFNRLNEKDKLPWKNSYSDEDNIWFSDYNTGTFTNQKSVFGDIYLLSDSLMNIQWKMVPNETREIAGFTCKKAQAVIFDSVYVFAFYTDEITPPGGPMGIHGLPGMILGITIPRMFTSWIANKVEVNGVNTSIIAVPKEGKKKKASDLIQNVKKVAADWGSYGQQAIWQLFL